MEEQHIAMTLFELECRRENRGRISGLRVLSALDLEDMEHLGNERINSSSLMVGKLRMDEGDTFSAFASSFLVRELEREATLIFGSTRAMVERFMCRLVLMGTALVLHGEEYVSFMVRQFDEVAEVHVSQFAEHRRNAVPICGSIETKLRTQSKFFALSFRHHDRGSIGTIGYLDSFKRTQMSDD